MKLLGKIQQFSILNSYVYSISRSRSKLFFFPEYLDCAQVQSAGPCSYQNMKVSAVQPISLMYNVQTSMNDAGHLSR